jgi:hypothetical protein
MRSSFNVIELNFGIQHRLSHGRKTFSTKTTIERKRRANFSSERLLVIFGVYLVRIEVLIPHYRHPPFSVEECSSWRSRTRTSGGSGNPRRKINGRAPATVAREQQVKGPRAQQVGLNPTHPGTSCCFSFVRSFAGPTLEYRLDPVAPPRFRGARPLGGIIILYRGVHCLTNRIRGQGG